MKQGNLLYAFTTNRNYQNPLAIDYLIEKKSEPSDRIIIIGLFCDEESVEIPELIEGKKVVAIDENAFSGYSKLKKITVPKTVERISSDAFNNSLLIRYDGLEMSTQVFFTKFKQHQREIIYKQLQGFATIDKNKRWRKSFRIIKKSRDRQSAQQNLVKELGLTDYQAEGYLDCGVKEIVTISYMNMVEKMDKFNQGRD